MKLPPDLVEQLEILAMEAQRGAPAGPHLARSLQRDVTALLRGRYPGVEVQVVQEGPGLRVLILLPRRGRPVERIVFHVGAG